MLLVGTGECGFRVLAGLSFSSFAAVGRCTLGAPVGSGIPFHRGRHMQDISQSPLY